MSDPYEYVSTMVGGRFEKRRVYVDYPEDVPDDFEVHRDSRGEFFYKVDVGRGGRDDGLNDLGSIGRDELVKTAVEESVPFPFRKIREMSDEELRSAIREHRG